MAEQQQQQQQQQNSELPDYKQEFLNEIQQDQEIKQLSQTQASNFQQEDENTNFNLPTLNKVTNTNDVWNSGQYSNSGWRKNLNTSYYNKEHGEGQHQVASLLNPEVANKRNNMRVTQISEYSNALHNNRVFQNPKFTSC